MVLPVISSLVQSPFVLGSWVRPASALNGPFSCVYPVSDITLLIRDQFHAQLGSMSIGTGAGTGDRISQGGVVVFLEPPSKSWKCERSPSVSNTLVACANVKAAGTV